MNKTTTGRFEAWARKRTALLAKITSVSAFGAMIAVLSIANSAKAQSNVDGSIYGKVSQAQSTIVIESAELGYKRSIVPSADGSYRVGSLPPGHYTVTLKPNSGAPSFSEEVNVTVGGSVSADLNPDVLKLDKFVVTGASINPIDFAKTSSSIVLDKETIDVLPMARSQTAVALLTPGTVGGDSQFNLIGVGRLASFGGASVAENAYYVNGFNLTNFRNGLGGSNVPFDFYDQFEVINDGYSAQYGRSTGGVINATTIRGTNTYKAEANVIYRPQGWKSPDVYFKDETGTRQLSDYNGKDRTVSKQGNVIVSSPIIKDKLFIAGLINQTNTDSETAGGSATTLTKSKLHNPFYALKVDAVPFNGQHFEYTFFSDKETTNRENYTYDLATSTAGATPYSTPNFIRGGKNNIFGYNGVFFEKFTLSAVYGEGRFDRTNASPQDGLPYVQDVRGALASSPKVIQGVASVISALDYRKAKRADLEYAFQLLGSHRLRVGYDAESNSSLDETQYGGGERWRYVSTAPGKKVLGVTVPAGVTELIYKRVYKTGGSFKVNSDAYFIEDNYSLMQDRLTFNLGFRTETFENFNAAGASFIKVANQKSPRLGVTYDVLGDKTTKVFFNYGRYFLPVATNTNIRLSGAETDIQTYYMPGTGTTPNGAPAIGAQFATSTVKAGLVPDTTSVVDKNLTPMYQDAYFLGLQRKLNKQWNLLMRGSYRNLGSSFDDAIVDQGLNVYAAAHNLPDQTGAYQYVLINPGKSATINWDFGDGVTREVTMPASTLDYPTATRKYYSVETSLERVWDGKWSARFSYVWSHNYGNTEGLVLSDNGQTDAGITQLFDTPALVHNTYGDLPNDRRHVFKAFGAYSFTKELRIGLNTALSSGKPINSIGALEGGDPIADFYGAAYLLKPRGSAGRTSWTFTGDVNLTYEPRWASVGKVHTVFQVDIFNVLNRHGVTSVDEYSTTDELAPNYSYLSATDFQLPRYFQFQVKLRY